MTTSKEPRNTATATIDHPELPPGDDERFAGYGVMGLPFASGHYLALRHIPATSFAPGYRAVWHRDPEGGWTFYSTAPGQLSCARYFGAATTQSPVRCDIDVSWQDDWTVVARVDDVLDWRLELGRTAATRLMSSMGALLPVGMWTNRAALGMMGRAAGPMLGVGRVRLRGVVPNGQSFCTAPVNVWSVKRSRAVLLGRDLGEPGRLTKQARLGDFWLPQKGIFAAGHGHFDVLDPARHHLVTEPGPTAARTGAR